MSVFEKVSELYRLNHPFVIFKKTNAQIVELYEQFDDALHPFTHSFAQNGFVLAPFNLQSGQAFLLKADRQYAEALPLTKIQAPHQTDILFDEREKQRHITLVQKAIETMHATNLSKVVISRKITLPHKAHPIHTFKQMAARYDSAFCYLFSHPKIGIWLAATPEKLLESQNGNFRTMALAGTQPANTSDLYIWGEKERNEQQIVTEVIAQKLQRRIQELHLSEVKTVRAGNIVHLCTDITGQLSITENPFEIAQVLHPTPAVCGFPDEAAKQFIIENEGYDRAFYCGYCGTVQKELAAIDFYVNLRCMQIETDSISIYVGGGILKDSDPQSEWDETQNKAQTMFSILA